MSWSCYRCFCFSARATREHRVSRAREASEDAIEPYLSFVQRIHILCCRLFDNRCADAVGVMCAGLVRILWLLAWDKHYGSMIWSMFKQSVAVVSALINMRHTMCIHCSWVNDVCSEDTIMFDLRELSISPQSTQVYLEPVLRASGASDKNMRPMLDLTAPRYSFCVISLLRLRCFQISDRDYEARLWSLELSEVCLCITYVTYSLMNMAFIRLVFVSWCSCYSFVWCAGALMILRLLQHNMVCTTYVFNMEGSSLLTAKMVE